MKSSTSIKLWRYFTLLVFCYCISPSSQLSLIPPTPNVTKKTIERQRICKILTCQLKWIETGDDKIFNARKCTGDGPPDGTMEVYLNHSLHLVDKTRILLDRRYYAELFCSSCDHFFITVSQYSRIAYMNVWNKWYEFRNCHRFMDVGYKQDNCVRFYAGMQFIRNLCCIIFTPLAIVLATVNVSVLYEMLKNATGASLYYHMFELFTDLLTSLTYSFGEHGFYWIQHQRQDVCGVSHMLFPLQTGWTLLEMLQWCNQMFLTLLIRDRCAALADPIEYNAETNHKKIASKAFLMVLFGTIIYYLPFILNFNFAPVKWHIAGQLGWDTGFTDKLIVTFYSFAPAALIMLQIHYSLKAHKLFKEFMVTSANLWASPAKKAEERKEAKAKGQLLVGTVFLNIFVGMVSALSTVYGNRQVEETLKKISVEAYEYTKSVIYTLRMLAFFANSTLCVLLHMLTCRPYRTAFRSTFIGRIFWKLPANQQSTLNK